MSIFKKNKEPKTQTQKQVTMKSKILKNIRQLFFIIICCSCLLFESIAQTIQYKGASGVLFATSDSRLLANVVEEEDLLKVEVLGIGYIHAGVLSFTLAYDTSKLTLMDNSFQNKIPFASSVPEAMELSPTLPFGYFIDVTQHAAAKTGNMAYYKGGIGTMSYNKEECWKVGYGKVDKAFTLFLKKKITGTHILSSDLGFYLGFLPKREPKWGIDNYVVGYKYGTGTNVHIGNGIFMDYFNEDMFAFRWSSTVTTDEATNIALTSATLNGSFERSRFNPTQSQVTLIDDPSSSTPLVVPNTILGWDTISHYGFIYSMMDADIISAPFSKTIQIDGIDYELTSTDIINGHFTINDKTFFIIFYDNASANQMVTFSENLTGLERETDYYAWSFMNYAFQTSEFFSAVGEKIMFTTDGCEDHKPQISVTPAGAYTTVGSSVTLTVTDDNTTDVKTISINNPLIASVLLKDNTIVVIGNTIGNTEIIYTSINEEGCKATYIIPVQVGTGDPTGILTGRDIVKCNLPGGGDIEEVQIAYIMGGVSPWKVTISDNNGTFSVDVTVNSLNDLPVNIPVVIPENKTNLLKYTTYTITNIVDIMGNNKQTHYGSVRIGASPNPTISTITNKEQVVCADANTLPVLVTGVATTYHYTVDEQIGLMNNYSVNGIPSFTAINETNAPIIATIIITPEYRYDDVMCIGESDTAYITVLPKVSADFATTVQGLGKILFTDASANAVAWSWDFGDGTTNTAQSPLHTFAVSAPYTVTLTVTSADGCTATVSKTITVSATTDLAANFHIEKAEQCLDRNVFKFTNQSRITTPNGHVISDYLWDFGDGNTATIPNPVHTYTDAGTYIVTLTVTESPTGTQSSISQTVKVTELPVVTLQPLMAICENARLQIPLPSINWNGNKPTTGTWSLNGYIIDPANTYVALTDDGKELKYTLSTDCGDVSTSAGTISVIALPVVEDILSAVYCSGEQIPEQILGDIPNVTYQWKQMGENIGLNIKSGTDNIPAFTAVNNGTRPLTATFEVTATNGTCKGNTVRYTITVNPELVMISNSNMGEMCSETRFNYTARSNVSDVTFYWERVAIAGINNGTSNDGVGAMISEVLNNDTNNPVTVTYRIEMSKNNCVYDTTVTVIVKPTPKVVVEKMVNVCEDASYAHLKCELDTLQQDLEIMYNILFDVNALSAGFDNIIGATLTGDTITIPLPDFLPLGVYGGILTIHTTDGCVNSTIYQFHIQVNERPRIIAHPESVALCEDDGFTLSVTATGRHLTYQWYKDEVTIQGATSSNYTVDISNSMTDYGSYYVEVSGECGTVTSNTAEVEESNLSVIVKWTDVIFISNENDYFVGYQWYKDGIPVGKDGNYQSYVEDGGLDGTYYVEVMYSNGTKAISCPRTVHNKTGKRTVLVYPNPVQPYGEITIDMRDYPLDEVENAKFEMFDMLGRRVGGATIYSQLEKVQLPVAKGAYMYRITTEQDEMIVGKIIVY